MAQLDTLQPEEGTEFYAKYQSNNLRYPALDLTHARINQCLLLFRFISMKAGVFGEGSDRPLAVEGQKPPHQLAKFCLP